MSVILSIAVGAGGSSVGLAGRALAKRFISAERTAGRPPVIAADVGFEEWVDPPAVRGLKSLYVRGVIKTQEQLERAVQYALDGTMPEPSPVYEEMTASVRSAVEGLVNPGAQQVLRAYGEPKYGRSYGAVGNTAAEIARIRTDALRLKEKLLHEKVMNQDLLEKVAETKRQLASAYAVPAPRPNVKEIAPGDFVLDDAMGRTFGPYANQYSWTGEKVPLAPTKVPLTYTD